MNRNRVLPAIALMAAVCFAAACGKGTAGKQENKRTIVASDTLLSGMIVSLLPPEKASVTAVLPPNQCPGHYDIKLSDIRKVKNADLVVAFRDMPFMDKAEIDAGKLLILDTGGRNWMAPDAHIVGLKLLADELSKRFPEDSRQIELRRDDAIVAVTAHASALGAKLRQAAIPATPVLAASMQKKQLEWMGFHVVGEYGRPESISAKEIVRLAKIGRDKKVAMIVDNLQSGPDAGKGIAEELGVPHVILSNFPLEKGYAATVEGNVEAVLAAVRFGK